MTTIYRYVEKKHKPRNNNCRSSLKCKIPFVFFVDVTMCWHLSSVTKNVTVPSCLLCPSSRSLTHYPIAVRKRDIRYFALK